MWQSLSAAWSAALLSAGLQQPALPAGLVRTHVARKEIQEACRLALLQRLPHYSAAVVRARLLRGRARARAARQQRHDAAAAAQRAGRGGDHGRESSLDSTSSSAPETLRGGGVERRLSGRSGPTGSEVASAAGGGGAGRGGGGPGRGGSAPPGLPRPRPGTATSVAGGEDARSVGGSTALSHGAATAITHSVVTTTAAGGGHRHGVAPARAGVPSGGAGTVGADSSAYGGSSGRGSDSNPTGGGSEVDGEATSQTGDSQTGDTRTTLGGVSITDSVTGGLSAAAAAFGGGSGGAAAAAAAATSAALGGPLTEAVWVMKFSADGQYLAVAGGSEAGAVLRVWRVRAWGEPPGGGSGGSSTGSLSSAGTGGPGGEGASARTSVSAGAPARPLATHGAPLFDPTPYREYLGHETHIVDIAWSRSNLLLSASMDSYVRLWHVSRAECLHKFQHPDCVTAVDFHPSEDNYFLSGCLDKKLRIWSLETGRVMLWQPTQSMITAAAFSPDARLVAVGLYNGFVYLYRSDGLQYYTTLECRPARGKHRRGRKVTGLEFSPHGAAGSHLLISTNDSRVRLVSMDDFSTAYKYAGLLNGNMQIRASFDWLGDRIISGSEDRRVCIWRRTNDQMLNSATAAAAAASEAAVAGGRRVKVRSYEWFVADDGSQPPPPGEGAAAGRAGGGSSGSGGGGGCCMCSSAAATQIASAPGPAPATPSAGAARAGAGADAPAASAAGSAGLLAEPDPFEDLEARAELQAYYASGRIATTVAIFAPAATLALARPAEAMALWKRPPTLKAEPHDAVPPASDRAASAAYYRELTKQHVIILAADSRGFIRVYENTTPPFAVR